MNNTVEYVVRINPMRDMVVLLDMMRYEQSTVVDWNRGDQGSLLVTLRTQRNRYVPDRWSSFLITPREV